MIKWTSYAMAALIGMALASPASAQNFDDSSIRGTWALSVAGFEGSALGSRTELFAIGRVIFDGDGGCRDRRGGG